MTTKTYLSQARYLDMKPVRHRNSFIRISSRMFSGSALRISYSTTILKSSLIPPADLLRVVPLLTLA